MKDSIQSNSASSAEAGAVNQDDPRTAALKQIAAMFNVSQNWPAWPAGLKSEHGVGDIYAVVHAALKEPAGGVG